MNITKIIILKKLYDYPYYLKVENGENFYLKIIEFIKNTTDFLNNKANKKISPKNINEISDCWILIKI